MSQTIASRYAAAVGDREPFLQRAYTCAELTIPALLPRNGTVGQNLYEPWQSIGSRGVNFLANKFHTAVLPPNAPFMKLQQDEGQVEKMTSDPKAQAALEEALSNLERRVMKNIEGAETRATALEAFKHLIVAGNFLLFVPDDGGLKGFRMDHYVVRRDDTGAPLETIVEELVAPEVVPQSLRQAAQSTPALNGQVAPAKKNDQFKLYTRIWREGNHFRVAQEVNGQTVPGSEGHYPLDACPWLPLRLIKVDGEDYSRSHVEELLGDLRSCENLSRAIVEGVAALAKLIILVNPAGVTTVKTIKDARNGDVRPGKSDDVTFVQANGKAVDFNVAQQLLDKIEARLSYAFLLNSAVQRSGERVTAEEIRYVAGELEQAQGGAYTMLAKDFQLPLVNLAIRRMKRQGTYPRLPPGLVKPIALTGLDALGRGADFMRLRDFMQALQGFLPPEIVQQYLNPDDLMKRVAAGLGIDSRGLVKTPEEVAQAIQQAQLQQAAQAAVPGAMAIAKDQMAPQQGA